MTTNTNRQDTSINSSWGDLVCSVEYTFTLLFVACCCADFEFLLVQSRVNNPNPKGVGYIVKTIEFSVPSLFRVFVAVRRAFPGITIDIFIYLLY